MLVPLNSSSHPPTNRHPPTWNSQPSTMPAILKTSTVTSFPAAISSFGFLHKTFSLLLMEPTIIGGIQAVILFLFQLFRPRQSQIWKRTQRSIDSQSPTIQPSSLHPNRPLSTSSPLPVPNIPDAIYTWTVPAEANSYLRSNDASGDLTRTLSSRKKTLNVYFNWRRDLRRVTETVSLEYIFHFKRSGPQRILTYNGIRASRCRVLPSLAYFMPPVCVKYVIFLILP